MDKVWAVLATAGIVVLSTVVAWWAEMGAWFRKLFRRR